jgi:hypothetical protein
MMIYISMFVFSLYLIAYGWIALFKKDWIWKLRDFSARIERKEKLKRDTEHTARIERMGNAMALLSLVLGITGFIMNVMMVTITR